MIETFQERHPPYIQKFLSLYEGRITSLLTQMFEKIHGFKPVENRLRKTQEKHLIDWSFPIHQGYVSFNISWFEEQITFALAYDNGADWDALVHRDVPESQWEAALQELSDKNMQIVEKAVRGGVIQTAEYLAFLNRHVENQNQWDDLGVELHHIRPFQSTFYRKTYLNGLANDPDASKQTRDLAQALVESLQEDHRTSS